MKATITYIDNDSFTPEELRIHTRQKFGEGAAVHVGPDSNDPYHLMYFAIQQLLTAKQLDSFFDDGSELYHLKLNGLIKEVEELAHEAVLQVIQDNEHKMT